MGGVWEHQIQSTKSIFAAKLKTIVKVLMTKDWEHLWLKQRQSLTQDL